MNLISINPANNKKINSYEEISKDSINQIIDLNKDVLWEAGYFERENTSPNPLTNLTSETKYTIESTKIPIPTYNISY